MTLLRSLVESAGLTPLLDSASKKRLLVGTYVIEINSDNNNKKAWDETVIILISKEGELFIMEYERSYFLYIDPFFIRIKPH